MSATGHHVPPYFVFARKRMNPLLIKDGPTGCDMAVTDTSYMDTPTFLKYLGHFEKHTSPTEQNPVLVLLDNHVSHVSLQVVTFAKDNYIHLLSLPPHSSQKTQPLDPEPLQIQVRFSPFTMLPLLSTAFAKTATVEIAREGFRATGLYPMDKNIFSDEDFMPAEGTE
nr:unnamed protein product [Callosobruchus analis]